MKCSKPVHSIGVGGVQIAEHLIDAEDRRDAPQGIAPRSWWTVPMSLPHPGAVVVRDGAEHALLLVVSKSPQVGDRQECTQNRAAARQHSSADAGPEY